jgi:acyl-CoA thioesterase I
VALIASGCSRSQESSSAAPPAADQPVARAAASAPIRIVVLGDSLAAGLGLQPEEAFPSLLQSRLRERGYGVEVVNAGVSGDTSAGGLRRLDWSLEGPVRVLIVELGGNDGLRGLPPAELQRNLATLIERAQARHIAVILAGMEAPPNLGRRYTSEFRQVYRDLSERYKTPLLPFLLDGVAGIASLNQGDGIHPNAAGARKVADNLWPFVERAVRDAVNP